MNEIEKDLWKSGSLYLREEMWNDSTILVASFLDYHRNTFSLDYPTATDLPAVSLTIDTNGGSTLGALAIGAMIRSYPKPVKTVALGRAFSAGAMILAAGTPGHRYAYKWTEIMVHDFNYNTGGFKDSKHLADWSKAQQAMVQHQRQFWKQMTNASEQAIDLFTGRELYLTAEEAKTCGIIDHVL